ncbi:glycosyltransferase family 25 protein [Roseovarius amoyensis]|uniref:glycosyltransferase family 25 protein n=1 Tax=Roseovarius amoyensis TaxID=2211448 RepID=UPI000DBE99C7|nr:glycosyltransferase family 25 protein [Roseovarius amoyensis]
MTAHAFVLHLARAQARRENAQALLADCGVPGEIWPAVDGAALSMDDLTAQVGAEIFAPAYPFSLRPGEVGCFLSHRQIWAEIIRRNLDCALVLEDDVALDPSVFPQALRLAKRNIGALGYIQLQTRPPRRPAMLLDQDRRCRLTQPVVTPVRASAQLISRSGAQLLLEKSTHFDRPVDTYVQSHWFTGLRPGVVFPAGVRTISDQLEGSTIQIGRKPMLERIWREWARSIYRYRLARFSRQSPAPRQEARQ